MRRASESNPIHVDELRQLAEGRFGDMVKGVVDLRRGVLLLDADMHSDQEAELLAEGADQRDLWGINLYPDLPGDDFWQFNLYAGYRFPRLRGAVTVGVLNLGGEDYHLNPLTPYNELPHERVFVARLRLNF